MRVMLVALILTMAVLPSAAVAQFPEPYHRPGEKPLSIKPSEINPEIGNIAEYDFRLGFVAKDAVSSVRGTVTFAVLEKNEKFFAIDVSIQFVNLEGFADDIAKQLAGQETRFTLIFDSAHELKIVLPPDALDTILTSWIYDYTFLWEFLKSFELIESGSHIRLEKGTAILVTEARDEEGRRFLQLHLQDPKIPQSKYLPAPYVPVIEATLIPSWPMIRSMFVVGSKPVMTFVGPRILTAALQLQRYRAAR